MKTELALNIPSDELAYASKIFEPFGSPLGKPISASEIRLFDFFKSDKSERASILAKAALIGDSDVEPVFVDFDSLKRISVVSGLEAIAAAKAFGKPFVSAIVRLDESDIENLPKTWTRTTPSSNFTKKIFDQDKLTLETQTKEHAENLNERIIEQISKYEGFLSESDFSVKNALKKCPQATLSNPDFAKSAVAACHLSWGLLPLETALLPEVLDSFSNPLLALLAVSFAQKKQGMKINQFRLPKIDYSAALKILYEDPTIAKSLSECPDALPDFFETTIKSIPEPYWTPEIVQSISETPVAKLFAFVVPKRRLIEDFESSLRFVRALHNKAYPLLIDRLGTHFIETNERIISSIDAAHCDVVIDFLEFVSEKRPEALSDPKVAVAAVAKAPKAFFNFFRLMPKNDEFRREAIVKLIGAVSGGINFVPIEAKPAELLSALSASERIALVKSNPNFFIQAAQCDGFVPDDWKNEFALYMALGDKFHRAKIPESVFEALKTDRGAAMELVKADPGNYACLPDEAKTKEATKHAVPLASQRLKSEVPSRLWLDRKFAVELLDRGVQVPEALFSDIEFVKTMLSEIDSGSVQIKRINISVQLKTWIESVKLNDVKASLVDAFESFLLRSSLPKTLPKSGESKKLKI